MPHVCPKVSANNFEVVRAKNISVTTYLGIGNMAIPDVLIWTP